MKKIQYIAPSIKVANIQLQTILAGSDMGLNESKVDTALSKESMFDEEEEDY